MRGRLLFSYDHKLNYICACTVKPYDVSKVRNALGKYVYCVTDRYLQPYLKYDLDYRQARFLVIEVSGIRKSILRGLPENHG